jgi:hypothetical protein
MPPRLPPLQGPGPLVVDNEFCFVGPKTGFASLGYIFWFQVRPKIVMNTSINLMPKKGSRIPPTP